MKYQSVASFDKHLREAFPDHLSRIYMVATACDFERKKMIEKVTALLCRKDSQAQIANYDASVTSIEAVLEQLNTKTLFGGYSIVVFDVVEKLKKADAEKLAEYLFSPSHDSFLVLGANKALAELYQKGKKEMVVLDLSEEKPWERQRRLNEWLFEEAKTAEKHLSSEAAAYIFEHIGFDMPSLHQELVKLICYVGARPSIQLHDAKAICSSRYTQTGWQLADGLIWGKEVISEGKNVDPFLLIGQLRYQLQMGCQITSLLEKNATPSDISRLFPNLRPQVLEKYVAGARQKKTAYFRKGLIALYDLECASKSSALDPQLLLDRFLFRLRSP